MRNILNIANEGHREPGSDRILSLEEEQDALVEATQDQAQVESDLAQVERIGDMSDALEDLAVVADGIEAGGEEPTNTEGQLIDTMANMAVAGTDVAPDEIVPALENFKGTKRRYAAETIRERAKAIWESIRKFLKGIREKIQNFFYKYFGTIPGLKKRIEDLKKRVSDNGSRVIEHKKITISSGVAALSANYKTPGSDAELKKNFGTMVSYAKDIFGAGLDHWQKGGDIVLDALNDFDAAKAKESAEAFVNKFGTFADKHAGAHGSGTIVSGNRFGEDVEAKMYDPLLGNVSLVTKTAKTVNVKSGSASVLGVLEGMRHIGAVLVPTSDKPKDTPASFELSTLSNSAMHALLEDAEELLDILEKFQRGKRHTEMKAMNGKLDTASDKASTSMSKLDKSDDASEREAVPYFRALLNFNTTFVNWMKDPAMPMVTHSMASIRGAMNVVEKSLAAYK